MKIKLLANERKDWAISLTRSLSTFLKPRGFSISHTSADVTICVGGDGSIFHYFNKHEIRGAILGIGSKTSGVCQFKRENLKMKKLIGAISRNLTEDHLSLLASLGSSKFRSINDVVIHSMDHRIIFVFFEIDGKKYQFEGDGIIVSTPVGSGAYAHSAGGMILPKTSNKVSVVPICPYKRTIKPMVVDSSKKITIWVDRDSDLVVDGIYKYRLNKQEKLIVRKGKPVSFLKV